MLNRHTKTVTALLLSVTMVLSAVTLVPAATLDPRDQPVEATTTSTNIAASTVSQSAITTIPADQGDTLPSLLEEPIAYEPIMNATTTKLIWSDAPEPSEIEVDAEACANDGIMLMSNGLPPTYQEAHDIMIGLKDQYPEGMPWTNFLPYGRDGDKGDAYWWKGGSVKGASGGVGCAAFVFLLSDASFDSLPSRTIDNGNFSYEDIKVGDILRVNNSHFVIVLEKSTGGVIIAEANYNKSVHWGRAMSKSEVMMANFIVTRYPQGHIDPSEGVVDAEVASDTENGLTWSLTQGGKLTLSGSGTMANYTTDNRPGWENTGHNISSVVIDEGITSIGDYAFYQSTALSIQLPGSCTSIGESAFAKSNLVGVTIPENVETIGNNAFLECANLTSVSFHEGLKTIGNEAFKSCPGIKYIDFPSSITTIGAGAFWDCVNVLSVRFKPGSVDVNVGENTFTNCQWLMTVTLPKGLTQLSPGMFSSCKILSELYIPTSVTSLGEADKDSPFMSAGILKIYFGGSQNAWNAMLYPGLRATLQQYGTQVICDAEFKNPFADDPDDPGDLVPDESENPDLNDDPCKDGHTGTADANGNCTVCGKPIETEPGESEQPNPDNPGSGDNQPPVEDHQHVWSTEWSNDTAHHWKKCTVKDCPLTDVSQSNSYGDHSYGNWVIDTDSTTTQEGIKHRLCTICQYRQEEKIPVKDDDTDNNTGNSGSNSGGNSGSSGSTGSNSGNSGGSGSSGGSSNGGSSSGGGSWYPGNSWHPSGSNNSNTNPSGNNPSNTNNNKTDNTKPDTETNETKNPDEGKIPDDNNIVPTEQPNDANEDSTTDIVNTAKVVNQLKKELRTELKVNLNTKLKVKIKAQLQKKLKKQLKQQKPIKAKQKTVLKAQLKKTLKPQLKASLKKTLKAQLKSEFGEQLNTTEFNEVFIEEFNKCFNQNFNTIFNKQFSTAFKKVTK